MREPTTAAAASPPARLWERICNARIPLWAVGLLSLCGVAVTIAFGAIVAQADRHGALGKAAAQIASIPNTLAGVYHGLFPNRPKLVLDYVPEPGGLHYAAGQSFVDPGYVLLTEFSNARQQRVIRLMRLSDGKMLREYAPDVRAMLQGSTFRSAIVDLQRDKTQRLYFPMHPMLTNDGGLILHDTSPLTRIDACGKRQWMIDGIFHHAVERAPDGTLWAADRQPRSRRPGLGPLFGDENIVHLRADGTVLGREAIIDILDRNGLGYLWRSRPYQDDPIHLNDVQPVPGDGPYWHAGDLLLSLRNLSMIALYRPTEGRIVWHREMPWRFQHDVAVIDDHRISVFDNNWRWNWQAPEKVETDGHNRLLVYDFAADTVSDPLGEAFRKLDIRTHAQGRAMPLPGGDFLIEETERGRLFRIAPDGSVRWRYVSADPDQHRYELRWSRYLDPIADRVGIQAAVNAKCE